LLNEARKDGVPVDKEILLAGHTGNFPGDQELMEAVMTMYKAVGFNVKLKMFERSVWRTYNNKPFPPGPYVVQKQHNNDKGDAGFTVIYAYHCKGITSSLCDKKVDALIEKAQVATGDERKNLWREVFKRVHEEIISDVILFHMIGFCRVGKRINFKPTIANTSQIELAPITFR
jgi:peptide/nickel transport system substrate-binding protein